MTFKIDVTFNGETFQREVSRFVGADLAGAMSNAANEATGMAELRLLEAASEGIDVQIPSPYASKGVPTLRRQLAIRPPWQAKW